MSAKYVLDMYKDFVTGPRPSGQSEKTNHNRSSLSVRQKKADKNRAYQNQRLLDRLDSIYRDPEQHAKMFFDRLDRQHAESRESFATTITSTKLTTSPDNLTADEFAFEASAMFSVDPTLPTKDIIAEVTPLLPPPCRDQKFQFSKFDMCKFPPLSTLPPTDSIPVRHANVESIPDDCNPSWFSETFSPLPISSIHLDSIDEVCTLRFGCKFMRELHLSLRKVCDLNTIPGADGLKERTFSSTTGVLVIVGPALNLGTAMSELPQYVGNRVVWYEKWNYGIYCPAIVFTTDWTMAEANPTWDVITIQRHPSWMKRYRYEFPAFPANMRGRHYYSSVPVASLLTFGSVFERKHACYKGVIADVAMGNCTIYHNHGDSTQTTYVRGQRGKPSTSGLARGTTVNSPIDCHARGKTLNSLKAIPPTGASHPA